MGYRHPKRRLSTRDVSIPKLFRQQAQPAAEELAGNLNEHNIQGGTLAPGRYSTEMLYDFKYAQRNSGPNIDTSGTNRPNGAGGNAHHVSDAGEWELLEGMDLSYTEGEHVVWAIGWCQYGIVSSSLASFLEGDDPSFPQKKPRAQFAIRVNGVVVEETITGTERADEASPRGTSPLTPVSSTGEHDQRSLDYKLHPATGSMCWAIKAVRIQCQVQVPQGLTTVEFVARRVPPETTNALLNFPPLYVWNRTLVDVVMKLGGNDISVGQEVIMAYPEDGDALNAATTATALLDPLVSSANALNADAIRRSGLRNEHLPLPAVISHEAVRLTSGSSTTNVYPGWASSGTIGLSPNWQFVEGAFGARLEVFPDDGSGSWDFTNFPGFVLIFSNVNFTKTEATAVDYASLNNLWDTYGVFAIGTYYTDGSTSLNPADEGWVNNTNILPTWDNLDPALASYQTGVCSTDMPLFSFFDFRTSAPAQAVNSWRTMVSLWNHAEVTWENSSIFALIFRP